MSRTVFSYFCTWFLAYLSCAVSATATGAPTTGCHDSVHTNKAPCKRQWAEQLPSLDSAGQFRGWVRWVFDGDSLQVLVGDRSVDVRIAQIDAPERDQPYGWSAALALIDLVRDREVRVQPADVDRYGRVVAHVFAADRDVGRELLTQGAVWCYARRPRSTGLCALERGARQAQRGLWGLAERERIPPWEWPRQHRPDTPPTSAK